MSQDHPIPRQDSHPTGLVTVEWGSDRPASRGRISRTLAGLGRDRRLAPFAAIVGCVAAAASLVGEWMVVTIPMAEIEGTPPIRVPAGVAEIGNFGVAYLTGLFGMIGCLALVFFGAAPIRHTARIFGLATSSVLLAVLLAATVTLPEASARLYYLRPNGQLQVSYGRGLVMALVATAVLGLALLIAGLVNGATPADDRADRADHADRADRTDRADDAGRGRFWRRPRTASVVETGDGRSAPIDLTVTAAPPFVHPDQPGGI